MFKKLAIVAASIAIATPAFASFTLVKNHSTLNNTVTQVVTTGGITTDGKVIGGSTVVTGDALNSLTVTSKVNKTSLGSTEGKLIIKNASTLNNTVMQTVTTGGIYVDGKVSGTSGLQTGSGQNVGVISNVVNTTSTATSL
jgi:hypothetical protein